MAGTTVSDDGAVLAAFDAALDAAAVDAGEWRRAADLEVRSTMGRSKIDVFRSVLGDDAQALSANAAFEAAYQAQVDTGRVRPLPGAEETVAALRRAGMKVVLLTGFSAGTRDLLVERLGWEHLADAVLCPADAGRGRPAPDLVLSALLRTATSAVSAVAAAGDTANDMRSALAAGAPLRVGVLTGTHDAATLWAAGATHVLADVTAIGDVLGLS